MAMKSGIFIFVFGAIFMLTLIIMMPFIMQYNAPATSMAENASEYFQNSSVVNKTMGFAANVSVQTTGIISPIPLLLAIFALAGGAFAFLVVVKK